MKTKKLLSIILSVLMITTCFSSAFTAFAAEDDVAAVTNLINSFDVDMTAANVNDEDLAAYNNMISAYNALSSDEIEKIDVFTFDKLLLTVYDRELTLLKQGGMSGTNAYKAVQESAAKVITMPSYVSVAAALAQEANSINSQAKIDAFLVNLAAAPVNAAILAGGYYNSQKNFRYSISEKYGGELLDLATDKIYAVTQKADSANAPVKPATVKKPSAGSFALGTDDPAYIEAYQKYLDYRKALADYNVANYVFKYEKHYLSALKALTEAAPYFSFMSSVYEDVFDAKRDFITSGETTKIAEVMEVYNTLTPAQKTWFEATDDYTYGETVFKNNDYDYAKFKIIELIDFCVSMEFYQTIKDFEDVIAGITLPCTNADIATAKAAYKAVPEELLASVSADTLAKYKEILASAGPDASVDNVPDLDIYPDTDVSLGNISGKDAKSLINSIANLVFKATGSSDLSGLINNTVLTNKTVVTLSAAIYELLAEETDGLINVLPSDMPKELTEEKFAPAVAALAAAGEDWDAVVINSGDFGFEDGDAEGFLDAMSAMLRGGALIHVILPLENKVDSKEGTYIYGAYEELIEIFEILDLKAVMSSAEYTDYVNSAENKDDAKFRAILAPIVYLLVDIGNDPVNTLLDVLPKLAYAIDSGLVNTQINKLLSMLQVITLDPVDLTTEGLYKILNDELLTPESISVSEDDFAALISSLSVCGEAVTKESVKRGLNYRMGIESDSEQAAAVLLVWVLDFAGKNPELVNTVLGALAGDNALIGAVLKIIITLATTVIPLNVVFKLMSIFLALANFFVSFIGILG